MSTWRFPDPSRSTPLTTYGSTRGTCGDPIPEAPYEVVGRISPVPLLVVHGDADSFFPLEHGQQLYGAAAEPRELWIEPGFGHAEVAATPDLIKRIGAWASAAVATARPRHDGGHDSAASRA